MKEQREYKIGMACALGCAVLWGVLPLYWKALIPIDSMVIIFYRILLVGVCTFLLSLKLYGFKGIKEPLAKKGAKTRLFLAGLLITANWSAYIWAVNAGHAIQTSIGYYMEPIVVCIFGVFIFKEKLSKFKIAALCLAMISVAIILLYLKQIPTVAFTISITFAIYAAIKKAFQLEAVLALFYETMFLMLPALGAIIYFEVNGKGAIAQGEPYQWALLALVGIATAIPLALFGMAANRVPMVTLGMTAYIAPSMTLILSIFIFKEPFDRIQFISFAIIWVGLVIFTVGEVKESKRAKTLENSL